MAEGSSRVKGETRRSFEFGIGVDLRNPFREALRMHEKDLTTVQTGPATTSHGWMFHLDATNLIVTDWSPIVEDNQVVGMLVRVVETEGKTTTAKLSFFRDFQSALKVDFNQQTMDHLNVKSSSVKFNMHGYEWAQIELRM